MAVDDVVPPENPDAVMPPAAEEPVRAAAAPAESARWEFLEILSVVILAAESLRILGSLIAGIIDAFTAPVGLGGNQLLVGTAMDRAANFSDGPGIVLLLVSLGLLWWRAAHWTDRLRESVGRGRGDLDLPVEAVQVHRLRGLARWAFVLFVLAAAGALAFVVGDILVNTAGGVTSSLQWQAYADDLFSLAYLIIAVAGVVASWQLIALCDVDVALIESTN